MLFVKECQFQRHDYTITPQQLMALALLIVIAAIKEFFEVLNSTAVYWTAKRMHWYEFDAQTPCSQLCGPGGLNA